MRTSSTRMVVTVVAMMIGAMVGAVPAGSDSPIPPGQEGKIPPGDWTAAQIDTMLHLIDEAETVLPATYPMVATDAELSATLGAMGYHDFGVDAPGGYAHWINNSYLDGDTLDPAHVESLVYRYDPDDSAYHLVSAMYMLGSDYDADSVPAEIAWLPGWHAHGDLCATPDLRFAGFAPCSGSSIPLTNYPMMHVWIVDNPCEHRFGGVDQGGLHCDVTHHHPDDHDPDGHDPDGHDPDGHDPDGHDPDGHHPGGNEPDGHEPGGPGTPNVAAPTAGPAVAVEATPTFTG